MVCIQKFWFSGSSEDNLDHFEQSRYFRQDRYQSKNISGNVETYANSPALSSLSLATELVVSIKCHPKLFICCGTIISNIYVIPFCSTYNISPFGDAFIRFLAIRLSDSLCFVVGELNGTSTYSRLAFSSSDPSLILTSSNQNFRQSNHHQSFQTVSFTTVCF